MAELSLDFKNEIINEIINEKRRYVMTENEDGTVSFTDATSYSQTGTKYGAEEVIEEREAINQNTNVIGGDAYDSSKSYAADDYFIYNNQLCKALTAISAGTALSEGTNYEVTSLENEIAGLNGKSEMRLTHEYFTTDILVYKKGNTVTMTYFSDVNGNIPTGDMGNLFTLPEEYRPPNTVVAFTGPVVNIQVRVGIDGSVNLYNYGDAITQQTASRFTLTYVVD